MEKPDAFTFHDPEVRPRSLSESLLFNPAIDVVTAFATSRATDYITQIAPAKFVIGDPETALLTMSFCDDLTWSEKFLMKFFPGRYAERMAVMMERSSGLRVVRMSKKGLLHP